MNEAWLEVKSHIGIQQWGSGKCLTTDHDSCNQHSSLSTHVWAGGRREKKQETTRYGKNKLLKNRLQRVKQGNCGKEVGSMEDTQSNR